MNFIITTQDVSIFFAMLSILLIIESRLFFNLGKRLKSKSDLFLSLVLAVAASLVVIFVANLSITNIMGITAAGHNSVVNVVVLIAEMAAIFAAIKIGGPSPNKGRPLLSSSC